MALVIDRGRELEDAGAVAGPLFSGPIYLVPFFTGAIADRLGFRPSLMLAFALLTVGYGALGVFNTLGPVLVGLTLIILGGAIVKPVISGTVSKSSNEANRARAFSIFYMVVNIGSFTGKTVVAPMRIQMGVETVPWFSSGAALAADDIDGADSDAPDAGASGDASDDLAAALPHAQRQAILAELALLSIIIFLLAWAMRLLRDRG